MQVAIVHDYLNQRGGAERVVLELARIWPEAPIYTSLYRPASTFPEFAAREIRTSFLDRLPVDEGFRTLAPLLPAAFRGLGTLQEDLVISSSSGWAHGVRTAPGTCHVVYCHTPARWLYHPDGYVPGDWRRVLWRPAAAALRSWDCAGARRADVYLANAEGVRLRIRAAYGIDAVVVHPPVETDRFTPSQRGERLLVVSRLLPYKRVDLAVAAATKLGLGLDVVGTGPELARLQELAGPTVRFHGRTDDATVTALMEGCRAVCLPGSEDFGIVPIEANAAGKPVVAFAGGGALETLEDGVTAAFFSEPTVGALVTAIMRADAIATTPEDIAASTARFSRAAFAHNLLAALTAHGVPASAPGAA